MTFDEWYSKHGNGYSRDYINWMRKAWEGAILAEREQCAKVCKTAMIPNPTTSMFDAGVNSALNMCIETILSRGIA